MKLSDVESYWLVLKSSGSMDNINLGKQVNTESMSDIKNGMKHLINNYFNDENYCENFIKIPDEIDFDDLYCKRKDLSEFFYFEIMIGIK